MTFNDTMTAMDDVRHSTPMSSEWFVEAVQYQQVAIEARARLSASGWSAPAAVAGRPIWW